MSAKLRLLVDVLNRDHGNVLRFRCITCERNPRRPSTLQPLDGLDEIGHGVTVWEAPEGTYSLELYAPGGTTDGFLVLPFDLETWRPHLLHDVRAEWNRAFISSRGVQVQEWEPKQGRRLTLNGPPAKKKAACSKCGVQVSFPPNYEYAIESVGCARCGAGPGCLHWRSNAEAEQDAVIRNHVLGPDDVPALGSPGRTGSIKP